MKVSLNWIKQFTAVDLPVDKLVEKIGAQLGAVEEVEETGLKYKGILAVKVIECRRHPDADKLSLCLVDDGGINKKVMRGQNDLVEVVCGAPNVKAGMLAAWIPPGVTVPSTFDKEPFVIEAREIRGTISNGMLASAKELGIGDDHSGIVVIDKKASPGDSFAELYRMDDYIIDIENKMFTHRPDLFGMLGIARELAGIQRRQFKSPDWYREDANLPADGRKNVLKLAVKNDLPKLVPRFCAVAVKDVKVEDSPLWLRAALSRVGVKSINNIVDLTNFYMLLTAQPLHAYDYDKLKTGLLGIRESKKGEKLRLLGGKEIVLDEGSVVITDGSRPVGLGGIMGGADTEVDEKTKNIVIECASFDMNRTRRTAMQYGLFTDAATRFTKDQSPRQNLAVLVKATEDIRQLAGGRIASPVVDDKHFTLKKTTVTVGHDFINSRLGLDLPAGEMKKLLENVEFQVKLTGGSLAVTAPFWRTDIEIAEDIVEEVGRLYGYDKLPVVLPKMDISPAPADKLLAFKARLREILKQAGANEVLTYSFVHGSLLEKTGQDIKDAYHIKNALSPDLQYYRLSLMPSLLDKVHPNIRAGYEEFALFELGKGHNQKMKDKAGLPVEFEMLSLVYASKGKSIKTNGSALFAAKATLDYLASELGIELEYRPIKDEEPYPVVKPFDHTRSASVWVKGAEIALGMAGEYEQSVIRNLKLPAYCSGFEIGIEPLLQAAPATRSYQALNRFPQLEQDFNLRASSEFTYAELTGFMHSHLETLCRPHGYIFKLEPLDIYQKQDDSSHKQTTWRIILWHQARTLTTEETNKLLDGLAQRAKQELKAERV
jgi:phenylalanyl-tRNA synthetase beta chain